ncbi:hypothetical protein NUW58_g8754 [Xylaria curta]|uniref:Uncharacterized protein n=1 Tax=Xylaria curta TaxID=42375 RepID=A0ACC1N694_9PEZI|nr:hypothetical protein NUW58_g8754 [Xylaria curta]
MDERCEVIKGLGGRFCEDIQIYIYLKFLSRTAFAFLAASTFAQSISIALYRSNTTCLSNAQADVSYTSSPGAGCQSVNLFPDGEYKAAGAFGAKVTSIIPGVVLRLFDDTACSDRTPDEANGDGSSGCAAEAASGAGWMSFRVDTVAGVATYGPSRVRESLGLAGRGKGDGLLRPCLSAKSSHPNSPCLTSEPGSFSGARGFRMSTSTSLSLHQHRRRGGYNAGLGIREYIIATLDELRPPAHVSSLPKSYPFLRLALGSGPPLVHIRYEIAGSPSRVLGRYIRVPGCLRVVGDGARVAKRCLAKPDPLAERRKRGGRGAQQKGGSREKPPAIVANFPHLGACTDMSGDSSVVVVDTVGSLLAIIGKLDPGCPAHPHLRLLEETLDEAKRDFQELPVLVNGRFYYENDRKADSLDELHELRTRFEEHSKNFKYWVRAGGPIEAEWAAETRWLKRELHRAQCRAVRRIHDDLEGSSSRPRCLGALIVRRSQQRNQSQSQSQSRLSQPQQQQQQRPHNGTSPTITTSTTQPSSILNSEVVACNTTGTFQRVGPGNRDIAFVCDFCDGTAQHRQQTYTKIGPQQDLVILTRTRTPAHTLPCRGRSLTWSSKIGVVK